MRTWLSLQFRQELGNTDSSLRLLEPAIDRFVTLQNGEGERITHWLLLSSQQAHSLFFSTCRLPGVSASPGDRFNYSLLLKMPQLFIMIILFGMGKRVCEHVCPLRSSWSTVLWESDIPIDLRLPRGCVYVCASVSVCVCARTHLPTLSSLF